jgi:hypothetical protein
MAPEERIADTFNGYFANFDIRIDPVDVKIGSRREINKRGWWIAYRVPPDDGGFPSLEFYAVHRMTDDRHVLIWADGYLQRLDALWPTLVWDPKESDAKKAAKEKYLSHNRRVTEQLRAAGLYPGGDVNAYPRTGGDPTDMESGAAQPQEGGS